VNDSIGVRWDIIRAFFSFGAIAVAMTSILYLLDYGVIKENVPEWQRAATACQWLMYFCLWLHL
jgi:hypothetical protein